MKEVHRGSRFFLAALQKCIVGDRDAEVLLEAAHVLDLLDDLQAALDEAGAVVDGRPNPIVTELRQQRLVLARLMALLPPEVDPDGDPVPTWRTERARKAAASRWAGHEKRGK